MFSRIQLINAVGCSQSRADDYFEPLRLGCTHFEINTFKRLTCFFPQIGHESLSLHYSAEIWGPSAAQRTYERDFEQPWPSNPIEANSPEFKRNRKAYFLGNDAAGDGKKYAGHGPIQTTGKKNHRIARDKLIEAGFDTPDFEVTPLALTLPKWGSLASCLYWYSNGCNALADADRFDQITRVINGADNGADNRRMRRAKAVIALVNWQRSWS